MSMPQLMPTKTHHYLLLYLLALLPFLFGIAYLIGFNQQAQAAPVTQDSISTPPNNTGGNLLPYNWQHTVGNFPNRILLVTVNAFCISGLSVSYKGTPLTRVVYNPYEPSLGLQLTIWYLLNPPVGSGAVNVNCTGGGNAGAATFYNVDQANPFGAQAGTAANDTTSAPITTSVTVNNTNSNQLIVDAVGFDDYRVNPTFTPGSGQTKYFLQYMDIKDDASGPGGFFVGTGSTKPAAAGSTTMTWTITNHTNVRWLYAHSAIALNPLPLPTATPTQVPPAPTATPTLAPAPTATPTPSSSGGNIINLNFGISNLQPWIQAMCGGIRMDNGLSDPIPTSAQSPYAITTNATCTNPGIFVGGDTSSSFGQGHSSSTNWQVGGTLYPEVFNQSRAGKLSTAYYSLLNKAKRSHLPITDLATVCTLSNCTLPANLPHGIYQANQNLTLNSFTTPANQHYVFLVNGTTTLPGTITVLSNSSSTLLLSSTGDIIVPSTLGVPANVSSSSLDGIFSTDQSMIINSSGNCTDQRLNIAGAVVTNAALTGGSFQNKRDLCAQDSTYPTVSITQRLDFLLNLPDFLRTQSMITNEVAP